MLCVIVDESHFNQRINIEYNVRVGDLDKIRYFSLQRIRF